MYQALQVLACDCREDRVSLVAYRQFGVQLVVTTHFRNCDLTSDDLACYERYLYLYADRYKEMRDNVIWDQFSRC